MAPRENEVSIADVPNDVQKRFLEAIQYEDAGDLPRAVALYREILAAHPDYAPACINMGTIQYHMREFESAEQLYRRATQADPGYALAYFNLGNVLDDLGRADESIAAYVRALDVSPGYADVHYNLALAYQSRGRKPEAFEHWRAYLKVDKTGPWAEIAERQISKLQRELMPKKGGR